MTQFSEPPEGCLAILPAHADASAVIISVVHHVKGRPIEASVRHHAIIAWQVFEDYAQPVFIEAPNSSDRVLIRQPDQKWHEPGEGEWESVEEAADDLLGGAVAQWNREHPTPANTTTPTQPQPKD